MTPSTNGNSRRIKRNIAPRTPDPRSLRERKANGGGMQAAISSKQSPPAEPASPTKPPPVAPGTSSPKPPYDEADDEEPDPPPHVPYAPRVVSPPSADDGEPDPPPHATIRVQINGEWESVEIAAVKRDKPTGSAPTTVFNRCLFSLDDKVAFDFSDLMSLHDGEVSDVTRFAARLATEVAVEVVVDGRSYENVVEAILAVTPAEPTDRQIKRLKEAALRYAALADVDNMETSVVRVVKWLRQHGGGAVTVSELKQRARALAGITKRKRREIDPQYKVHEHPEMIRDVFADAPVSEEHQIPLKWMVCEAGVAPVKGTGGDDLKAPIVIRGRAVNVNTGDQMLRLAYRSEGQWHERLVPRADAADARKLVGHAGRGLPVTSENARDAVRYIADYERHNLPHLPVERVTPQLGWQGAGGTSGFLFGDTYITPAGDAGGGEPKAEDRVTFQGADDGDEQIVCGFRTAGTVEGWRNAIAPVAPFPRVRLILYAASAAPVLRLVGASNFVASVAGETSVGKTTSIQIAASVFGYPKKDEPDSIVHTWDGTPAFRERAPAVQTDLPFFQDETQRARDPRDVEQTIYDIAQGQGRGRGSPNGLRRRGSFHTVGLSTGEKPIASFTQAGGTRARVIEVWGSPFGGQSQELTALTFGVVQQVSEHYGHAGAAYLRYLVEHRDKWPERKAQFRALVLHFQGMAGGNAVAGRLAEPFAVITLAARLLHQAVDMPWEYADPVEPLYDELVSEVKEVDRSAAALRCVVEWADARPKQFLQPNASYYREQPGFDGWAGVRPIPTPPPPAPTKVGKSGSKPAKAQPKCPPAPKYALAFFPTKLSEILVANGFDPKAAVKSWKDKGWLVFNTEGDVERTRLKVRVAAKDLWVVAITEAAIKAAQAG